MNHSLRYAILGIILSMGAVGCASKGGQEKPAGLADQGQAAGGAQTTGAGAGLGPDGRPLGADARGLPMQKVVHFEYDKSEIREQDRATLDANGKYLAANPKARVRLEGHADERGSREYNLALGERRAQTVKRYLGILGVPEQQMNTLSYGEEKPADASHSETSWQVNRRVEIMYTE